MTDATKPLKTDHVLYELYDRPGYFRQLAREIAKTQKGGRVAVMTMPIDPREPLVLALIQELRAAAERGVWVILGVDAITFMVANRYEFKLGPLWFHGGVDPAQGSEHNHGNSAHNAHMDAGLSTLKLRPPFREMYDQLELIRKAGGTYRIINAPTRPFTLPVAGRSHIKLAVVNDTIKLGGCNLEDSADLDIMAGREDPELANYLFDFANRVIRNGNVREVLQDTDQHFQGGPQGNPPTQSSAVQSTNSSYDLFIDAGVPKQSRILDEALEFIDNSQEWLFLTCQYFPGGIVGKHLAQAVKRGVRVQVVFSHPSAHHYEQLGHYAYNALQKLQLPNSLFAHRLPKGFPTLHAKLLANEQGAILGSHNFATQGVQLGTAEIALHVQDPAFSRQAVEFVTALLPPDYGFDFN